MVEQAPEILAARAREGDEAAFRALVEGLTRTLMATAFRYTGDWEWARDLTQDTWVRVYRKLDRWDPKRSFTVWLYALHRNRCLDHLRRSWVRLEEPAEPDRVERLPAGESDDPLARLERREFRRRVLAAAGELSPSQREVFLRVDAEDRDQREVAEALGIRYGTLRVTQHAARKRVAELLRPEEGMA